MSIGDVVTAWCSHGHVMRYLYRGGPPRTVCLRHGGYRSRKSAKPPVSTRGLGGEHQKRRAELLPAAYGTPCAYCGGPMLEGQLLHLDHSRPRALGNRGLGDRMVHARCNTSAGSKLGNAMRRRRRVAQGNQLGSVW